MDDPNSTVATSSKRNNKKRLKSELKFRRKIQKLETRIAHAISRRDPVVEKSAKVELKALKSSREGGNLYLTQDSEHLEQSQGQSEGISTDVRQEIAMQEMLGVFRKLLSGLDREKVLENSEAEKNMTIMENGENAKIGNKANKSVMKTPTFREMDPKSIINDATKRKSEQHEKARLLLRHMTKGTQSHAMFQDVSTLRGYVRQKFHGRAALVIDSLGKLSPESLNSASMSKAKSMINNCDGHGDSIGENESLLHKYEQQRDIMTKCWEKLCEVRTVCSIGCGPGNDVVGLVSFLKQYFWGCLNENGTSGPSSIDPDNIRVASKRSDCADASTLISCPSSSMKLDEILLLDFAIDEWGVAVLDDLVSILVPLYAGKAIVKKCDVTLPLFSIPSSRKLVDTSQEKGYLPTVVNDEKIAPPSQNTQFSSKSNNPSVAAFAKKADIFLTSYLLSETRNQWDQFFIQLVEEARVGAIFYFAEPKPWQLHRLIQICSLAASDSISKKFTDQFRTKYSNDNNGAGHSPLHQLQFIWLDSSMHFPELQQLENRVGGPAVLMAIKQ